MHPDPSADRLLWLLRQGRLLTAAREVDRLAEVALAALLELTGSDRALLFTVAADDARPTLHAGRDAAGRAVAAYDGRVADVAAAALRERRPHLVSDARALESGPRLQALPRVRHLVCLPLYAEDAPLGALYADGRGSARPPLDVRVASLLAEQVACGLDNARRFERASNDLLTGLPNQAYFLGRLARALRGAAAGGEGGVLLIDLDAFARVNRAGGAAIGDRALVDVAHTLRDVLRSDGLVTRLGSDRFAALLPPSHMTPIALRLHDAAERVRAAIGAKMYCAVTLSACIGGVAFTCGPRPAAAGAAGGGTGEWGAAADAVVAAADRILARARARGAGAVEIASA